MYPGAPWVVLDEVAGLPLLVSPVFLQTEASKNALCGWHELLIDFTFKTDQIFLSLNLLNTISLPLLMHL